MSNCAGKKMKSNKYEIRLENKNINRQSSKYAMAPFRKPSYRPMFVNFGALEATIIS